MKSVQFKILRFSPSLRSRLSLRIFASKCCHLLESCIKQHLLKKNVSCGNISSDIWEESTVNSPLYYQIQSLYFFYRNTRGISQFWGSSIYHLSCVYFHPITGECSPVGGNTHRLTLLLLVGQFDWRTSQPIRRKQIDSNWYQPGVF